MVIFKCCQGCATVCWIFTNLWIVAAVVFLALTVASCDFVQRQRGGVGSVGLYSFGIDDACVGSYPETFTYGWLHAWAAICGVLAPIFGGIVLMLMVLDCCCKVCCSSVMQTTLLSLAELSQAFTFLLYASNACIRSTTNSQYEDVIWERCQIGGGSISSMVAFGCYFIAGCFLCFSPKPDPICQRDDAETGDTKFQAEEKPEQAVAQDEENVASPDPQSTPEEVKPQVY